MAMDDPEKARLKHKLGNVEQEKRALQQLLEKAADEIEEVVEADCEDGAKSDALAAASKLRRAASL
jgi:hypothetical protein